MLNEVSEVMDFPPVVGNVMTDETMAVLAGMSPIARIDKCLLILFELPGTY